MHLRTMLALIVAGTLLAGTARGMEPDGRITLQARLNTTCLPHRGGPVFLHLSVDAAGFVLPERSYEPMNIAVVLDRSGSMADERKLEYAKKALLELVDRLSSADILSIIIYDDRIETLVSAGGVVDKQSIRQRIYSVVPRGSTNLGGGLQEGLSQLRRTFRRGFTNRLILLSDGLANVGVVDPRELNRIAENARERSISVTTIGVGLDYNEDLMLGLARHGGGNYYFVESPSQLAAIFEREFHDLRFVVARNARIELSLGRGVQLLDVIGYEAGVDDGRFSIPLGDITAADHREICVELSVPEGSGRLRVARGSLRTGDGARCDDEFSVDIRYSENAAELLRGKDWEIQPKIDIAVSTRQVERAMKAVDAGRTREAGEELSNAARQLQSSEALQRSAAAAPMIQAQVERLRDYARQLKDSSADARKVKKSVQYDNYEVQKTKKP